MPAPTRSSAAVVTVTMIVVAAWLTAGCGSSETASTTVSDAPSCPTEPIRVVVSVDPWSDITKRLAGSCAEVTTVVGSASDPHDFEPTPVDAAAFTDADVVVVNGCGYDRWAEQAVQTSGGSPALVNGCDVVGRGDGDNPHLWYAPDAVSSVADSVTAALQQRSPAAAAYLTERRADWDASMQPYRDEIASIASAHAGRTFAATESVFDDLATALGLRNVTPEGFARAAANETDPSPADISAFNGLLGDGRADVLVVNPQTEGAIPTQLRSVAGESRVPVVEVTETPADGTTSFVDWQVSQLRALAAALAARP